MTTVPVSASPHRSLVLGARLTSLALALFWGVPFFGLIDLQVVVFQNEVFYLHYVLEVGWGLLYTVLVMVPLLCWAVRPGLVVLPRCVLVAGAAILLIGIAFGTLGQAAAGIAVMLSAAPGTWLTRDLPPLRRSLRHLGPLRVGTVAVGVLGAGGYVGVLLAAVHSGRTDEDTWGLMHLPMQAGLAVAVPAFALLALWHAPARGWRLGTVLPGVAATGLGVTCVAYPYHLGSAGTAGGWAMVAWAVLLAALAFRPARIPSPR